MSIQLTGVWKRFRVGPALVALAFAVAVFVLATQLRSISSTRSEAQVPSGQAIIVPATNVGLVNGSHFRPGCRPKVGCQKRWRRGERGSAMEPGK